MPLPPTGLCLSVSFEASKHDSRPSPSDLYLSLDRPPPTPDMREPSWPCSLTSSSCFCLRFPIIQHLATRRGGKRRMRRTHVWLASYNQPTTERFLTGSRKNMKCRRETLGRKLQFKESAKKKLWNTQWRWFVCGLCVVV